MTNLPGMLKDEACSGRDGGIVQAVFQVLEVFYFHISGPAELA